MTLFTQPKGYSTLDYTFELQSNEFINHKLNGEIKSLLVYKKENQNFHSSDMAVKLDTELADCHKYLMEAGQLFEMQFLNPDGTLRSKRVFDKGLIREFVFYHSKRIAQSREIFIYNDAGQLLEKLINDDKNNIKYQVKYTYDNNNRLENVIGAESHNYKYSYDESGGFYEIKYTEYNHQYTIHEVRYYRNAETENVRVILQNEPNIKFEDVGRLKKNWQSLSKFDNLNHLVFEQSKDLISNEVQVESSFIYSNNQLAGKIFRTKNGTIDKYSFEYENSKLVRTIARDEQGFEKSIESLHYNEQGDVIKRQYKAIGTKEEIYDYEYRYDGNKNWTEKKVKMNGKLFEITYRQIEYEK